MGSTNLIEELPIDQFVPLSSASLKTNTVQLEIGAYIVITSVVFNLLFPLKLLLSKESHF